MLLSVLCENLLLVIHLGEHMTLISPLAQRSNHVANVVVVFITIFVMTRMLPSSNWLENKHYFSVLGLIKLGLSYFKKERSGWSMVFGGSQSKPKIFVMLFERNAVMPIVILYNKILQAEGLSKFSSLFKSYFLYLFLFSSSENHISFAVE